MTADMPRLRLTLLVLDKIMKDFVILNGHHDILVLDI
jgi:hypothetical protein